MIDTHCHLDDARLDTDREAVLARAWAAGVTGIVVPGVFPEGWEALRALPQRDPRLQVALGIHPQALAALPEADDARHLARLEELLEMGGAVAVGECGLDGPTAQTVPLERQVKLLRRHFELARRFELPVLVHCLRVQPALRQFLTETPLPEAGVLLHSYSGGPELVEVYARLGCHFSFAGPLTFPGSNKPARAAQRVPIDRLHVETDAPDQSPHPHRGQRNEPGHLPLVMQALATLREVPLAELVALTTDNARRFFRHGFGAPGT